MARTRVMSKRRLKQWAILETHVVQALEAVADFPFEGMLMNLPRGLESERGAG